MPDMVIMGHNELIIPVCVVTCTTLKKNLKINFFWCFGIDRNKVIFELFFICMPDNGHNRLNFFVVTSTNLKQLEKREILMFFAFRERKVIFYVHVCHGHNKFKMCVETSTTLKQPEKTEMLPW